MYYKCTSCKEVKSFTQLPKNKTAYCNTCQCLRLFLPNISSASSTHPPMKSSGSAFAARRTPERSTSFVGKRTDYSDVGKYRSNLDLAARSNNNLMRSPSMTTFQPCSYFKLCLEFMLSLEYSKKLFNRKHNRCCCEKCYPACSQDFYVEGGFKYVIPRGWVRFGLYIDDAQTAAAENIWNKSVVSYHGTTSEAAKSIIEHHQFLLPGDQCIGGYVIGIRKGHIPNKFQVYTSPTIAYSGDDIYSPSISFRSTSGQSYRAKVVLQCRQQPGTYKIQAETIGADSRRICSIIPNSEVEYFTEV